MAKYYTSIFIKNQHGPAKNTYKGKLFSFSLSVYYRAIPNCMGGGACVSGGKTAAKKIEQIFDFPIDILEHLLYILG